MKKNIIYNEDCLTTMKNHIDEKSIDLVFTSPPYNMTKRKGGYADKQKRYDVYDDWKSQDEYIKWTIDIFNSYDRIIKDNGVVLYNLSYSIENPSLPYLLINDIIQNTNWTIADTITWKKSNAIPHPASYNRLNRIVEFVYVFCRKDELKTFTMNKKITKVGKKNGQNYYEIVDNYVEAKNNDGSTELNKATFSSDLVYKLVSKYAKENSIVYDNFMGTGTSAIGALRHNCKYIGSEISEKQVDFSNDRILKYRNEHNIIEENIEDKDFWN